MDEQLLKLLIAGGVPSVVFAVVGYLLKRSITEMDKAIERLVGKVDGLHQLGSARDVSQARLEAHVEALERRVDQLERGIIR